MSKYIGEDVKVVLFDHDDTLVDTIGPKSREHKHVARQYYGKELTDEEIRQHWGKPLSTLVGLLYDTDNIDIALQRVWAEYDNFPKELYPHSIKTIQDIRATGKKTGIVTSTRRPYLEADLEMLKIPQNWFDYMQTEENTEFHKPDPRVFDPALRWIGGLAVKPKEVVYIGDSLLDMEAALAAGFQFVGVGTGLFTPDEFGRRGAIALNNLGELTHGA
jgi:phosphoglycolate phosphatase